MIDELVDKTNKSMKKKWSIRLLNTSSPDQTPDTAFNDSIQNTPMETGTESRRESITTVINEITDHPPQLFTGGEETHLMNQQVSLAIVHDAHQFVENQKQPSSSHYH